MIKSIIVVKAANHVIGKDKAMPWHMPADLKHFKHTTLGHHVIMGRKTFESLKKPLPGRKNVIVTSRKDYQADGCIVVQDITAAFKVAKQSGEEEVFIAGGGQIYRETLAIADKIYLTEIKATFEGDTFFPVIDNHIWTAIQREHHDPDGKNPYPYEFIEFVRMQ